MRSSLNPGQIVIYDGNYEREFNVCTEDDVNAAAARNWIAYVLDAEGQAVPYKGMTGIDNVKAEGHTAPVEYYDLQGVRVNHPANGIYIRRQGNCVSKVHVK